jgi:hypothetical protein
MGMDLPAPNAEEIPAGRDELEAEEKIRNWPSSPTAKTPHCHTTKREGTERVSQSVSQAIFF